MRVGIYTGPQSRNPDTLSHGQTGDVEELPENPGGTFFDCCLFVPHGQESELPFVVPVTSVKLI